MSAGSDAKVKPKKNSTQSKPATKKAATKKAADSKTKAAKNVSSKSAKRKGKTQTVQMKIGGEVHSVERTVDSMGLTESGTTPAGRPLSDLMLHTDLTGPGAPRHSISGFENVIKPSAEPLVQTIVKRHAAPSELQQMLDAFHIDAIWRYFDNVQQVKLAAPIFKLAPPDKAEMVLLTIAQILNGANFGVENRGNPSSTVCKKLKKRWYTDYERRHPLDALRDELQYIRLPFTELQIMELLGLLLRFEYYAFERSMKQIEHYVCHHATTPAVTDAIKALIKHITKQGPHRTLDQGKIRLRELIKSAEKSVELPPLDSGEAWTNCLREGIDKLREPARSQWADLLNHCAGAVAAKPTNRWANVCAERVTAISERQYTDMVAATLGEIGKPAEKTEPGWHHPTHIHYNTSDLLRGFIWSVSARPNAKLIEVVGLCADKCFEKIPQFGPRSPKIGTACLYALSAIEDPAAVSQLTRLKSKVKTSGGRSQVDKALNRAADTAGMSTSELEELAAPTFGLTSVGELRQPFGAYTAVVNIVDTRKPKLAWETKSGKRQESVPAAVKDKHEKELKALRKIIKEIERNLPAHRCRIERFFIEPRTWTYDEFQSRYLDHPFIGQMARRLIWEFALKKDKTAAIMLGGKLVDVNGKPIGAIPKSASVNLWAPLDKPAKRVGEWREFLEDRQIRQPFKQAHREIYLLTDAERATSTYSNRFAAHILRQHQFQALARERGWKYQLQGPWDSFNIPTLKLPEADLKAEFRVEIRKDDAPPADGQAYNYIATDQVRFFNLRDASAIRLEEVPVRIFSEVMRDVDLFVGVASVGNDPAWRDHGPDGMQEYWNVYTTRELDTSSNMRKEILQRLVPKLAIADRCSFKDRFMVVKGDLHTYKIHLGSAASYILPNDEYLCIVPGVGSAPGPCSDDIFLPFEGDTTMSIILSKAFLLADDSKIKDRVILRQLRLGKA